MEKSCEICGKYFQTNKSNRKYCDDCSPKSDKLKIRMKKAIKESKERMKEPEVITRTCHNCGREYKTIPKLILEFNEQGSKKRIFCSKKCLIDYKIEYFKTTSTCRNCGKPLIDVDYYDPGPGKGYIKNQFCSDKCVAEYREKAAERRKKRKCAFCGKEYAGQGAFFCSAECYRKAIKSGWKNPEKREPSFIHNYICPMCKKKYQETYPYQQVPTEKYKTCSKECRIAFRNKEKEENRKKASEEKELCKSCKANYMECERKRIPGSSVIPMGTRTNRKYEIIECPKYKG